MSAERCCDDSVAIHGAGADLGTDEMKSVAVQKHARSSTSERKEIRVNKTQIGQARSSFF